jgi:hypothetical protein
MKNLNLMNTFEVLGKAKALGISLKGVWTFVGADLDAFSRLVAVYINIVLAMLLFKRLVFI